MLLSNGPKRKIQIIKTKQFQNEVLKFFVVHWRNQVFQFSLRLKRLSVFFFLDNDPVRFVLTNVERGPRSNFSDNVELYPTNDFGVIALNRPNFSSIYPKNCKLTEDAFDNAYIQKLKEISTSSLWHSKDKSIFSKNSTQKLFSIIMYSLQVTHN